jgi:hypothetical protein
MYPFGVSSSPQRKLNDLSGFFFQLHGRYNPLKLLFIIKREKKPINECNEKKNKKKVSANPR